MLLTQMRHNIIMKAYHTSTLRQSQMLAFLEAIQQLEKAVEIEENLAPDHPDKLASQYELAHAYLEKE